MATRATIAYAQDDGSFQATYLHYDGYPEYAGVILNQLFDSIEKVSALLAGGDRAVLEPKWSCRKPNHPKIRIDDLGIR